MVESVTPEDEAALAAVSVLMRDFNEEYDEPSPEPEALAAILRTRIADGNATVLLVRDDSDGPVGVAVVRLQPSLWSDATEAYLAELYVVPARRGQGFGRELLTAVLDDLPRGRRGLRLPDHQRGRPSRPTGLRGRRVPPHRGRGRSGHVGLRAGLVAR